MFNSRLFSLIHKEFIQIWRDPRTLLLVIAIPVTQILLMGYAATTDVRNIPMAVLDQNRSAAARELLDAYRAADYFQVSLEVDSEDAMREVIDGGEVKVGLIIPPDYTQRLKGQGSAHVVFILDGSDPTIASTSLSAAKLIGQAYATNVVVDQNARYGISAAPQTPVEVHTQVWYNPDMIDAYFMVPGVIGTILYALTSTLTATAVVRERERGTIEQLIVTPIRPWELVVGKILPYVFLAMINTLEVLAIGSLLFDVPIRSELSAIMLLSGLFLLSGLGVGLLVSTISNTQQEAMLGAFFTYLPSIFLSGFFFPIEAMPKVLQWISTVIPLRYYLVVIRSLLIKGVGIGALQDEILALLVFGGAMMTLAAFRFRKRLD